MKKFTFKFTKTLWVLSVVLLLISLFGMVWSIINLVKGWGFGAKSIISNALLIIVDLALFIFCVSLTFFKSYTVTDEYLFTRFGLLKFKIKLSDITEVTVFEKQKKLVVYFSENKYTVIIIDEDEHDAFANALKEKNSLIYISKKIQD